MQAAQRFQHQPVVPHSWGGRVHLPPPTQRPKQLKTFALPNESSVDLAAGPAARRVLLWGRSHSSPEEQWEEPWSRSK